jgi:hypothetical protein
MQQSDSQVARRFRIDESDRKVLHWVMETIMFKAPDGTKAKLRRINRNLSALLRGEVEKLLDRRSNGSAYEKAQRLCGVIKGGARNAATSKDYLQQYAQKGSD